jgi:hypothetical protein
LPQISHIIGGILDYCRHPRSLTSAPGLVAERFLDRWAYYVNELSLSGESWQLEKVTVNLVEGRADYSINAENFGKPVVVYVLDDERNIVGELEIGRFRDQIDGGIFTNLPSNVSLPAFDVPASRNTITFYSEGGQLKARVVKTPTESGTLVIHYVPSELSLSSLQDQLPFVGSFSNLFKIHTALVCLPDCEWDGMSDDQNERKRNNIEKSLEREFMLLTNQFNEYKSSLFQEQTSTREGWGDENEWYGGW